MPFWGDIGKVLLVAGGVLLALGLFFTLGGKLPLLGKLPGDISIHRGSTHIYLPIATSLLLSAGLTMLLSLILWILRR